MRLKERIRIRELGTRFAKEGQGLENTGGERAIDNLTCDLREIGFNKDFEIENERKRINRGRGKKASVMQLFGQYFL